MKIVLFNGSPKVGNSASSSLLADLRSHLSEHAEVTEIGLHQPIVPEEIIERLQDIDTFVFLYPLYVDGIPAHLLSCLIQLEKVSWGVGGGGGLAQMPTLENGHGPKAPVEKAIKTLAENILRKKSQENCYVSVAFPRLLYKLAAQMGWRQMIRGNEGKIRDLKRRPAKSYPNFSHSARNHRLS